MPFVELARSPLAPGVTPVRIRVRDAGAGRPIVFLHGGWGYGIYPVDRQIAALAGGGRMVIPVGGFFQELKVFTKEKDGHVSEKDIIPVRFVPMTGEIEKEKTPGEQ